MGNYADKKYRAELHNKALKEKKTQPPKKRRSRKALQAFTVFAGMALNNNRGEL